MLVGIGRCIIPDRRTQQVRVQGVVHHIQRIDLRSVVTRLVRLLVVHIERDAELPHNRRYAAHVVIRVLLDLSQLPRIHRLIATWPNHRPQARVAGRLNVEKTIERL